MGNAAVPGIPSEIALRTVASGRMTTCRPSFERNFGGIVLSLPV
jgi:hypothetical protein